MNLRHLIAILALGVAFGLAAFLATSDHRVRAYLGPVCATADTPEGFDLWTGLPHGRSYTCDYSSFGPTGEAPHFVQGDVPPDLLGRRALPFPLGFLLGAALVVGGLAIGRRLALRRRWLPTVGLLAVGLAVVTAAAAQQPRI